MSQERDNRSGHIDKDPVDLAVLVGIHHIKTAVFEARRG